jgi:predicted SnoaL-like aldol condensation-catalyzing enzyme
MIKAIVFATALLGFTSLQAQEQTTEKPVINFAALEKTSWSEQEATNVKLVSSFVQSIMNNHEFDVVLSTYNNDSYVQHNRNLPDGIEGLVGFLREFVQDYPEYSYDVKHIYADGEFVVFHSHATLEKEHRGNDGKGMNIIDTWKIQDGKIVEHWDSIQTLDFSMRLFALLTGGDIRNSNGVF